MRRLGQRLRRELLLSPEKVWILAVPVVFAAVLGHISRLSIIFFTSGYPRVQELLVRPGSPMSLRTGIFWVTTLVALYALLWTIASLVELIRIGRPVSRTELGRFLAFLLLLAVAVVSVKGATDLPTSEDVLDRAEAALAKGYPGGVANAVEWGVAGVGPLCERLRDGRDPTRSLVGAAGLWRLGDRSEATKRTIRDWIAARVAEGREFPPWPKEYRMEIGAFELLRHPGHNDEIFDPGFEPGGTFWQWWESVEDEFRPD